MACTSPLTGWRSKYVNKTGKRSIVFNVNDGYKDLEVTVPCGRCTSCRLEHSRQWAVRCMHESQMHKANSFITLTYAPEHLPSDHSIHKTELQKFIKRLRKNTGKELRYFACGEYGDKKGRPHYHAIIFGYDFPDKTIHTKTQNGDLLYRSKMLEKCWQFGHSLIGEVTFQSAAYVARYVMKKRKGKPDEVDPKTGKTNAEYYMLVNPETGEVTDIEPEFCLMSRRPGLGRAWLEKYKTDTDKDFITMNGNKMSLPKYYDSVIAMEDELDMMERKKKRRSKINKEEQQLDRLEAKRKIVDTKADMLIRPLNKI